jgi:hypothetical protein
VAQSKRRAKSRKQRQRATSGRTGQASAPSASAGEFREKVQQARSQPKRRSRVAKPERPKAPWHPLPLSELLIIVGIVAFVYGLVGHHRHAVSLFVGVAVIAIGTIEFSLREHLGGYRSHTVMLAFLPCVIIHSTVLAIVNATGHVSKTLNIAMLGVDIVVFLLLFRILRLRFLEAASRSGLARS